MVMFHSRNKVQGTASIYDDRKGVTVDQEGSNNNDCCSQDAVGCKRQVINRRKLRVYDSYSLDKDDSSGEIVEVQNEIDKHRDED